MGRCGLCGKLLDGNNVVMYPVDVGSNNATITSFGGIKEGFYSMETSSANMLPCCSPCVEKAQRIHSETNKALIKGIFPLIIVGAAMFFVFFAIFRYLVN